MTFINKILVPIDGSEAADDALDFALELADKLAAKMVLLSVVHHVTTPLGMTGTPVPGDIIQNYSKGLMDSHAKVLTKAVEKAQSLKPNLDISPKIMEGRPSETIVQVAEEEKFDLIVMGSRGLSGIKKIFLGSVSNEVVNHSTCPVLIVK